MKRKLFVLGIFLCSISAGFAQGEVDAYIFSKKELRGTARSVSMGGAFGALGGDMSAVAINPAGLAIYSRSEIVTSLSFQNLNTETKSLSSDQFKEKKSSFMFDNFAFVAALPMNSDVVPLLNFGFSYNKLKNYDRKYHSISVNEPHSLSDVMSGIANNGKYTVEELSHVDKLSWRENEWLPLMGAQSNLISNIDGEWDSNLGDKYQFDNELIVREKGSVNNYDFNMAATFSEIISAGITVSVTDMKYVTSTSLYEDIFEGDDKKGTYSLHNDLRTDGTGYSVGLGVIVKPINELRIGISYKSPTWYKMTNKYGADLVHDLRNVAGINNDKTGEIRSFNGEWAHTDYEFRTPDVLTFSLAGIIMKRAIISADLELTDYSKMKFWDEYGNSNVYNYTNDRMDKVAYRMAMTARVGAEFMITPQFAARVGYSWQQNPYKAEYKAKNNPKIGVATNHQTNFILEDDAHYFTWGLGYRFTPNFYTDLGFVIKNQKGGLYPFELTDKIDFKEKSFRGVLTLGYRF